MSKNTLVYLIITTVFLFCTFQVNIVRANKNPVLTCELSPSDIPFTKKEVLLRYTVTNHSTQAYSLLTWYTPLEGFLSKLFTIYDNKNKELVYKGPMVKRSLPHQDDYVTLKPQQSTVIEINLAVAYPLNAGNYTIALINKPIALTRVNAVKPEVDYVTCATKPLLISIPQ